MIVVSDSSPLISLARMGRLALLPELFGEINIPIEVWKEVTMGPNRVGARAVIEASWLRVDQVQQPVAVGSLGEGESAAIALAQRIGADFLIVDDRMARRAAVQGGLSLMGTLAVLARAYEAKLIPDLVLAIKELRAAGGRIGDDVILKALRRFQISTTGPECEDR